MDAAVRNLIEQGDSLFGKRSSLMSLWQHIADNFYPERADFTTQRYLGEEFASNLTTSYPLLARRDLGNTFSSMLRPTDKDWFQMAVDGVDDHEAKAWLQWASKTQKRAMYDRRAQFVRATKEGDHDFAAFGQTVITVEARPDKSGMVYRCWHLRDVVWCEGSDGSVESVHRKWKTTPIELKRTFGEDKIGAAVAKKLEKEPYCDVQVRHIVVPADQYQGEVKFRTPLVALFVDVDSGHVIEAVGARVNPYVIPRWQTVSGSQYAYSPATVCALPDARLIQAMTLTLLEAGEKLANPAMLAVQEAIRGDVSLYAGGITWVDAQYDERLGEVLRPMSIDGKGMPLNMELVQDTRSMIRAAFYLDKLDLPARGPEMTAYEVGQRVQEYIRNALPLFEPVEVDYNGALCERTFEVMLMAGGFGPPDSMPQTLSGRDIEFKFVSPLREAIEKQKGQVFVESSTMLAQAAALDPSAPTLVNVQEALRDTLEGIGVPTKWTRSREEVAAIQQQQAAMAQQQQLLESMGQAAAVAKDLQGVAA